MLKLRDSFKHLSLLPASIVNSNHFSSIQSIIINVGKEDGIKKNLIKENDDLQPINVYGTTKLIGENILKDLVLSDNTWKVFILRYFNVVGTHSSGEIGDNPKKKSTSLFPSLFKCLNNDTRHHTQNSEPIKFIGLDFEEKSSVRSTESSLIFQNKKKTIFGFINTNSTKITRTANISL